MNYFLIVSSWSCPFFFLVCKLSGWLWTPSAAAELDSRQLVVGETMLKFMQFRHSSTNEFLIHVKKKKLFNLKMQLRMTFAHLPIWTLSDE